MSLQQTNAPPRASQTDKQSKSNPVSNNLPALLSLTSVLNTPASRVGAILDASSDALETVTDGFGAGGVVYGLADAAASCANEASSGLGDAA
jgi:hypothetical protein